MKRLFVIAIGAFSAFSSFDSAAQEKLPINPTNYNKAKLFEDVPQKISLRVDEMEHLFEIEVGRAVTVKFSKDFYLMGTVVSTSQDASVRSMVMRATNRQGAVFTFSKIKDQSGSFVFRGRILSRDNGDAFEIVNENGQYSLLKKNDHEIIIE